MATWGMKASQLGYDVTTAADYQLLYSSQWPLLKIESQGTVTINDLGADQVIYTHNLGYAPMFWIFDVSGSNGGYAGNFTPAVLPESFGVNGTELKYFSNFVGSGSHTIRYYIFRLDLDTAFTAPTINLSPGSATILDNYGIKIAGPGKDVGSTDYRDFVVHSNTRSPMVHKVQAQTITGSDNSFYSPGYSATFTHDMGYNPLFFAFVKGNFTIAGTGYYVGFPMPSGNVALKFSSTSIQVHTSISGTVASVVMFKDQLLI